MKKTILTLVATLLASQAHAKGIEAGTYDIDVAHSKVGFEIPHLVIATVEGRFKEFSGAIVIDPKLDKSSVQATIEVKSIDTGIDKRDEHLKSPDFFDVAKNGQIVFKSTKVSGTPAALKIAGDLTIKGVTKKVTLDGKYLGAVKDGYGNEKVAFELKTKIKRQDFGLTWSQAVEAGPVVGDDVSISLKIQAAKKKQ